MSFEKILFFSLITFSLSLYSKLSDFNSEIKIPFKSNSCFPSNEDTINSLFENYNIETINPTNHQKFILGPCNPILFIPGIYGSRLVLSINCKNIYEKEIDKLMAIRIFCGNQVCNNLNEENEEHTLFAAITDQAFTLLNIGNNKYSACLGYFMQYFNKEEQCPILEEENDNNNKRTCLQSNNIRISIYGTSNKTKEKSDCGLNGIKNIIQTNIDYIDNLINTGAAALYKPAIDYFKKIGYEEGFSMSGLPYDYRQFISNNNFAKEAFIYQIERLYNNTGKKVIIVAHSYGNLITLHNLLDENNKKLLNKVKKFLAFAPPISGSSMLLDIFLKGMRAWGLKFKLFGKEITIANYDIFGQFMMYYSMPTLVELRPLPIINKILNGYGNYKEFSNAINERINLEEKCYDINCDEDYIKKNSIKFNEIFDGYYPNLNEEECKYKNDKKNNNDNNKELNHPCRMEIYNIGKCPSIIIPNEYFKPKVSDIKSFCGIRNSSLYYAEECDLNNEDKKCLNEIYINKGPYPYEEKEKVNFLINRFNNKYSKFFNNKKINESYFDKKELLQKKIKKLLEEHNKISITKDLPIPPIDTNIIYTKYNPSKDSFIYNEKNKDAFLNEEILFSGGDDTVQSWSSLLTAFKWIYDKKKKNLKQNIKILEYCSTLGKNNKFAFDKKKKFINNFTALSCECINDKNEYTGKNDNCGHSAMMGDINIIQYIEFESRNEDENQIVNLEKRNALINVKYDLNQEIQDCNNDLKRISDKY